MEHGQLALALQVTPFVQSCHLAVLLQAGMTCSLAGQCVDQRCIVMEQAETNLWGIHGPQGHGKFLISESPLSAFLSAHETESYLCPKTRVLAACCSRWTTSCIRFNLNREYEAYCVEVVLCQAWKSCSRD